MPFRTERFYSNYLQRYFDEHYGQYDETAEFFPNPEIYKWKFYIPELDRTVLLVCLDDGYVIEKRGGDVH